MPLIPPSLQPATRCVANRAGRLVGLLVLLPARSALPTKFRVPALPTPSTGTICTQCFGSLSLLPPYATHFTVLPPFPPTFLSAPSPTPWSLSPSSPLLHPILSQPPTPFLFFVDLITGCPEPDAAGPNTVLTVCGWALGLFSGPRQRGKQSYR